MSACRAVQTWTVKTFGSSSGRSPGSVGVQGPSSWACRGLARDLAQSRVAAALRTGAPTRRCLLAKPGLSPLVLQRRSCRRTTCSPRASCCTSRRWRAASPPGTQGPAQGCACPSPEVSAERPSLPPAGPACKSRREPGLRAFWAAGWKWEGGSIPFWREGVLSPSLCRVCRRESTSRLGPGLAVGRSGWPHCLQDTPPHESWLTGAGAWARPPHAP